MAENKDNQFKKQLPKASILALEKELGPEAALILYAQNGGGRDIAEAAELLGLDLTQE